MELTKEQIYKIGKDKFVYDTVNEILKKDEFDHTEIKEIYLDGGGGCILVTFSCAVYANVPIALGEAFGHSYPNNRAVGENLIHIYYQ